MPLLSVMFCGCLTYEGVGTLEPVEGNINSRKYTEVLDEHLWHVILLNFHLTGPTFSKRIMQLCTPPERPHSGNRKFVCVEVLRPSQPNGVMSSEASLPNHMFTGKA